MRQKTRVAIHCRSPDQVTGWMGASEFSVAVRTGMTERFAFVRIFVVFRDGFFVVGFVHGTASVDFATNLRNSFNSSSRRRAFFAERLATFLACLNARLALRANRYEFFFLDSPPRALM